MWYGRLWRWSQGLRFAARSRNRKVDIGSKIALQTVLKLMLLAITATRASLGPTSGTATSSRCRLRRGSLSWDSSPSNSPSSSLWVVTAVIDSGSGSEE
jgi:hypothetical protein